MTNLSYLTCQAPVELLLMVLQNAAAEVVLILGNQQIEEL